VALFNDGPISGIGDLLNYETSILDVASTEGIDTATKLGLAQDEIAADLLTFLLQREGGLWRGMPGGSRRRKLGVGDVVVTAPLKRWHTLRTLAMIFHDAYDNQLNDRYQGKWQSYDQLQTNAEAVYLRLGVGMVPIPAPKPAPPGVSTTAGSSVAGTYYFASSWVTSNGEEGLCSDPATVALSSTIRAVVSSGAAPGGITGWNLYAGTEPDAFALQNSMPLALGETWVQSVALAPGPPPGIGQLPSCWAVDDHQLRRG